MSESGIDDESPVGQTIEKEDDSRNRTHTIRHEKIFQRLVSQKISTIKSTKEPATVGLDRFPKICHTKVTQ